MERNELRNYYSSDTNSGTLSIYGKMRVVLKKEPISRFVFHTDNLLPPESVLTRTFNLCASDEVFAFSISQHTQHVRPFSHDLVDRRFERNPTLNRGGEVRNFAILHLAFDF